MDLGQGATIWYEDQQGEWRTGSANREILRSLKVFFTKNKGQELHWELKVMAWPSNKAGMQVMLARGASHTDLVTWSSLANRGKRIMATVLGSTWRNTHPRLVRKCEEVTWRLGPDK